MLKRIYILCLFICVTLSGNFAQVTINQSEKVIDYNRPRTMEIGGITFSGVKYASQNVLLHLSGLAVGQTITVPGTEIEKAITKLWEQDLFSDIRISETRSFAGKIFLDIYLQEKPKLSKFSFTGVTKSEADDIREKVGLRRNNRITDNEINRAKNTIIEHFVNKGYLNTKVQIEQLADTVEVNSVYLRIIIEKNEKIKIREISFEGNDMMPEKKLRAAMRETKIKGLKKGIRSIFKTSKFIKSNFELDKELIKVKYNELGYRDARILSDSIIVNDEKTIDLIIRVEEGKQYFFRDITWSGNTKYSSSWLSEYLGIEKGSVFNQTNLQMRLDMDQNSIRSLYQNQGYLNFYVIPVEVMVENDSIDMEIRIIENKIAYINNVIIEGNDKTNEHVIRRELLTLPGDMFSRELIMESQREIAQLGHFDPESVQRDFDVIPNPDGSVDLKYGVKERPNDQIEISGGWGYRMIVGTLGVRFNNFSVRNILNKSAWRPLPSGDGQSLGLQARSNGKYYQSFNINFVEPWLGGKKPNALSVSTYLTKQTNGQKKTDDSYGEMKISGFSVGLNRRLKWPDRNFFLSHEFSFQQYNLNNWSGWGFNIFSDGVANNLYLKTNLIRQSTDQQLYPRRGSIFSLSLQITPPYSLLNGKDYDIISNEEKYKWIEYHKWSFKASWFAELTKNLVLNAKAQFGYLGHYNVKAKSPFEGFIVGGSGMTGFNYYGHETVALRGYDDRSLTPNEGTNIYNKLTVELRYPISLNPTSTIYALAFLEGGNAWYDFKSFNPFKIKRSAGIGVRIFMPMFGMMGIDWGYGFDDIPFNPGKNGSQFHFVLGQQF
ncbi:outer membrane protein assembly factor BamA [Bacteroidota bacterium]